MQLISKIIVPFDQQTGQVYLNAVAENKDEAMKIIFEGSIEISDVDLIDYIEANLYQGDHSNVDFFPVFVPFSKITNEPLLRCIGTNINEAQINLSYGNYDSDDYIFSYCVIEMPSLDLLPSMPTL